MKGFKSGMTGQKTAAPAITGESLNPVVFGKL
jgi:hypothetical protein